MKHGGPASLRIEESYTSFRIVIQSPVLIPVRSVFRLYPTFPPTQPPKIRKIKIRRNHNLPTTQVIKEEIPTYLPHTHIHTSKMA